MIKISQGATYTPDKKRRIKDRLISFILNNFLWIITIILIIIMSFLSKNFLTVDNLRSVLNQVTVFGILAVGLTYVFLSGSFDLNSGAILISSAIFIILLGPSKNYNTVLFILLTLVYAVLFGAINGFLIGKLNLNPFIVTLAMRSIIEGIIVSYVVATNSPVWIRTPSKLFAGIALYRFFGIPMPVLILVIAFIISYVFLSLKPFGRKVLLTGSDYNVAKFSGINTVKIRFTVFILSALFAGFGGIILASKSLTMDSRVLWTYDFDAITALAVGGVSLFGGSGTIVNTFSGILFLGVLNNSMVFLNIPYSLQLVFKGSILLIAVIADLNIRRRGQLG
jgi:ribose transport system permease protein